MIVRGIGPLLADFRGARCDCSSRGNYTAIVRGKEHYRVSLVEAYDLNQ